MSTGTASKSRNPTRSPAPRRKNEKASRSTWLWVAIATVVLCAALVAVFAARGNDTPSTPGAEQTRPVTVAGDPLPSLVSGSADDAVGKPIPGLAGASFDGTPVNITRDGKAKLVIFVAHWCPHCRNEVPRIVEHLKTTPLPAGVELYAVSTAVSDTLPNYPPSAWLADEGWPIPTLADSGDGKAATAYGLPGFPYFVAADAAGNVVARTSGEISMAEFDQLVAQALGPG